MKYFQVAAYFFLAIKTTPRDLGGRFSDKIITVLIFNSLISYSEAYWHIPIR